MCCWTRIIAPNPSLVKVFPENYANSFKFILFNAITYIIYKDFLNFCFLFFFITLFEYTVIMKKIILFTVTSTLLLANPKTSVIFMIGDGMGPAYTTTYRYYHEKNTTVFDSMLVGMNSTYSQNSAITDSAAAATALASGVKTKNGFLGRTDTNSTKIQTVLEFAKENGYLTAMAVTSTLTHATPAAFLSTRGLHRDKESDIAKDFFIKNKKGTLKFDFLIGGGEKYFYEGYKDFNTTAKKYGVSLYRNGYNIEKITHYPFIAFTAYDYPAFAIDENDDNRYRVAKMTKKSLELLENKPFFLMIEGSQIDWCGHINDIGCTMAELEDFARSVEIAKFYVDKHPDTLLVVTADHSTGGLAIGKKIKKDDKSVSEEIQSKSYIWYPNVIKQIKASSIFIAKKLRSSKDINTTFKKYTSLTLDQNEYQKIKNILDQKNRKIRKVVNDIINGHSNTGWTTHGHTAVDVETFAYGKGSDKFSGFIDNTDIAKKIFEILSGK
jgi:alkaline phosphatase